MKIKCKDKSCKGYLKAVGYTKKNNVLMCDKCKTVVNEDEL